MTYKENNSYFLKCLDLESMGFTLIDADDETYQFKKTDSKITIFLSVTIMSNRLYGLNSWLVYDEIEALIDSLMNKYQIEDVKRYPMTISFYKLRLSYSYMYEAYNTSFENKEKINDVSELVKKNINDEFIPLWEKYADLQVVNDEIIEKIPQSELSNYIVGKMSLKRLIIMKMCKNKNFDEYKNWLLNNREVEYSQKVEGSQKALLIFKDLIEYIERVY